MVRGGGDGVEKIILKFMHGNTFEMYIYRRSLKKTLPLTGGKKHVSCP